MLRRSGESVEPREAPLLKNARASINQAGRYKQVNFQDAFFT
jgi:hypothetical protein